MEYCGTSVFSVWNKRRVSKGGIREVEELIDELVSWEPRKEGV